MNAIIEQRTPDSLRSHTRVESTISAVSWAAIFAGALVAAAVSLVLVALGTGVGFASVSPWPGNGASVATFTAMTAVWLIIVQWVAAGVGGYLTGRLRTKWTGTHSHEVFFRDTAHGFITWATGTVVVSVFLASAVSSLLSGGTRAATAIASGASQGIPAAATNHTDSLPSLSPYDLDVLFRGAHADSNDNRADPKPEAARILAQAASVNDVPTGDRTYLAEIVQQRTGITQDEAQRRVDSAIIQAKAVASRARQAADTARKSAAEASIFTALSMLIGAFIACIAAALGGRQRDEHV